MFTWDGGSNPPASTNFCKWRFMLARYQYINGTVQFNNRYMFFDEIVRTLNEFDQKINLTHDKVSSHTECGKSRHHPNIGCLMGYRKGTSLGLTVNSSNIPVYGDGIKYRPDDMLYTFDYCPYCGNDLTQGR